MHWLAQVPDFKYEHWFVQPLPVWDDHLWPWLLVPLCAAVSIVYKSIRCKSMSSVPREASVIFFWILIGMACAGAALAGAVKVLESQN